MTKPVATLQRRILRGCLYGFIAWVASLALWPIGLLFAPFMSVPVELITGRALWGNFFGASHFNYAGLPISLISMMTFFALMNAKLAERSRRFQALAYIAAVAIAWIIALIATQ